MKIAVTGATGLVGKKVMEKLDKNGFEVAALTRDRRLAVPYISTNYEVDSLREIISEADAVIHLAAVRMGEKSEYSSYQKNENLTENVLQAMAKTEKCKHIIYLSSISVYSDIHLLPWSESTIPQPESYYGLSKLVCEYLCRLYKKHGIHYTIFRCAHILGIEDKGYMLSKFMENAYRRRPLCVQGKSIAKREFIYVKDVANAIEWALKSIHAKDEIFNLGCGIGHTNYQIADIINRVFGNDGKLEYLCDQDEKISSSYMNINKIIQAGFHPEYTIEDAMLDLYGEYNEQHMKRNESHV